MLFYQIMGLEDMYKQSRDFALGVNFEKDHDASVFEYTIRYIGGLLGAYEITRDRLLLFKGILYSYYLRGLTSF